MRGLCVLVMTSIVLSGCAEGSSIYHMRRLKSGEPAIVTVDAKQRNLLINSFPPDGSSGGKFGRLLGANEIRMCAEASPDVFSALNGSASLTADVVKKTGSLGIATAETAGTIERTQTINLLRESMYRTCERYLSGAIGKPQFIVQAARDQRAMVKILAIEQLTRTVRPPAIILSAPAVSTSVADGATMASLLKDYSKERSDAKALRDDTAQKFDAANKGVDCETTPPPEADDARKKWDDCKAAAAARDGAKAEYGKADERLNKALSVAGQMSAGPAATVSAGAGSTGAGGQAIDSAALTEVAKAVAAIVNAPDINESLMFCFSILDISTGGTRDPTVIDSCRKVVQANGQQDLDFRQSLFRTSRVLLDQSVSTFERSDKATSVKKLQKYLLQSGGSAKLTKAEIQRRIALVQEAAQMLGVQLSAQHVASIPSSPESPLIKGILENLLIIEKNREALALISGD